MVGEPCWFCKKNAPDEAAAREVQMYGNVRYDAFFAAANPNRTRSTWNTTTIRVPRCSSCKADHARDSKAGLGVAGGCLGIGLSLIALVAGVTALTQGNGLLAVIAAAIFLSLVSVSVALIRSMRHKVLHNKAEGTALGIERESFEEQYPKVLTLLAEGWKIGDKRVQRNRWSAPAVTVLLCSDCRRAPMFTSERISLGSACGYPCPGHFVEVQVAR